MLTTETAADRDRLAAKREAEVVHAKLYQLVRDGKDLAEIIRLLRNEATRIEQTRFGTHQLEEVV